MMNYQRMLNVFCIIIISITIIPVFNNLDAQDVLQTYPKGKIILKNGIVIEGNSLEITSDKTSVSIGSAKQEFDLKNVQQIMAKRGKAKKVGKISGFGCLGVYALLYLNAGGELKYEDKDGNIQEATTGQFFTEAIFMSSIFFGAGYLIGMMMDSWQVVYYTAE